MLNCVDNVIIVLMHVSYHVYIYILIESRSGRNKAQTKILKQNIWRQEVKEQHW